MQAATWVSCLIKIVSHFGNQYCSLNYFLHISIISLTTDLSFWKTNVIHPLFMFDISYYVSRFDENTLTSFVYTSTYRLAWWRAFIIKSWWLQLAKQGIWTPSECLCTYFQFWFPGIHIILWYQIWHSIVGTTVTVHLYDFLYLGKYLEEPHNISALKQN